MQTEEMKQVGRRFSAKQIERLSRLNEFSGKGYLRPHFSVTGSRCYRLVDDNINPVENFDEDLVKDFIRFGALSVSNDFTFSVNEYFLDAR
jgi:hypothetical protein